MVARTIPVDPFDLVVFGATGDLARRKLFPALFSRMAAGQAPPDARAIAVARADLDDESFRASIAEALDALAPGVDPSGELRLAFLERVFYVRLDVGADVGWDALAERLGPPDGRVRAFYLAVAPRFFERICARLAGSGIATADSRIVIEKPFGRDLESARVLNRQLAADYEERQLYRIDHYLGKETVQNLMAIRFANALFEPLWNARHVDHVQITVAEDDGIRSRGEYYDQTGALRDMVQNHLMQLLCLTAMEPPAHFDPDRVRDEKLKVIRALEPIGPDRVLADTVRGQYRSGPESASYAGEVGRETSRTESFVAIRAHIANWRWNGTPFYLRTGKRLRARLSEIAVVFRDAPHSIFDAGGARRGNALIIRLQPNEGIMLRMTVKEPGPGGMRLVEAPLDMTFAQALGEAAVRMPDAYERLIMDVIRGDQTLFMRGDEVEAAWAWTDPIVAAWDALDVAPALYDPGSSGPEDALMLLHKDGRRWREIAS